MKVWRSNSKQNVYIINLCKNEHNTLFRYPSCKSAKFIKNDRLFKCLKCHVEAHRDVVATLNIALVSMKLSKLNRRRCRLRSVERGEFNQVLAHPAALRIGGLKNFSHKEGGGKKFRKIYHQDHTDNISK